MLGTVTDKLVVHHSQRLKQYVEPLIDRSYRLSKLAQSPFIQIACMTVHEVIFKTFRKAQHSKRTSETFEYKDGGTVHLDWVYSSGSSPDQDERPILVMVPGFNN